MTAITLENVCIIFGKKTDKLSLACRSGQEPLRHPGRNRPCLGVHNCSITIAEGRDSRAHGTVGFGKVDPAARHQSP